MSEQSNTPGNRPSPAPIQLTKSELTNSLEAYSGKLREFKQGSDEKFLLGDGELKANGTRYDRLELNENEIEAARISNFLRLEGIKQAAEAKDRVLQAQEKLTQLESNYQKNLIRRKLQDQKGNYIPAALQEAKLNYREAQEAENALQVELLNSNPDYFLWKHGQELKNYNKQSKSGTLIETESVRDVLSEIEAKLTANEPVFIHGPFGAGKTEKAIKAAQNHTGLEPLIISGRKNLDASELYGHQVLSVSEGVTVTEYFMGPIYQAMEEGRIIILDEMNAIPHDTLISLNHILTRKPGDTITIQQDSGKIITVKDGYGFIATGNLPNERGSFGYQGRQELDVAFLDRFSKIEDDYLPQSTLHSRQDALASKEKHELYEAIVASFMDSSGDIVLPPEALDDIWNMCAFVARIQNIYTKKDSNASVSVEGNDIPLSDILERYTISMRGIKKIISAWKAQSFTTPLKTHILEYINEATSPTIREQLPTLLEQAYSFSDVYSNPEKIEKNEIVANVYGLPPERTKHSREPNAPVIQQEDIEDLALTEEQIKEIEIMKQTVLKMKEALEGPIYDELFKQCPVEFAPKSA